MTRFARLLGLTSLLSCVWLLSGCYAGDDPSGTGGVHSGTGSAPGTGGGGGIILGSGGGIDVGGGIDPGPTNPGAFPAAPIYDGTIDPAATAVFTADGAFTGPLCVFEPHLSDSKGVGAMYPM